MVEGWARWGPFHLLTSFSLIQTSQSASWVRHILSGDKQSKLLRVPPALLYVYMRACVNYSLKKAAVGCQNVLITVSVFWLCNRSINMITLLCHILYKTFVWHVWPLMVWHVTPVWMPSIRNFTHILLVLSTTAILLVNKRSWYSHQKKEMVYADIQ